MILYDSNFKLLGASKATLELLGYPSFGTFTSKHSDISELFVQKDGFLKLTENHFITDILKEKYKFKDALIKTSYGTLVEVIVSVSEFYLGESGYEVDIVKKTMIQGDKKTHFEFKIQNLMEEENKKSNLPNVFVSEYKREIRNNNLKMSKVIADLDRLREEELQREIAKRDAEIQKLNAEIKETEEKIDEKWLESVARRLEIEVEELKGFLRNLVQGAKNEEENLHEAILLDDKERVREIASFLLDPIDTLGVKPLKNALESLENSTSETASENFRKYKSVLEDIDKIAVKRNEL